MGFESRRHKLENDGRKLWIKVRNGGICEKDKDCGMFQFFGLFYLWGRADWLLERNCEAQPGCALWPTSWIHRKSNTITSSPSGFVGYVTFLTLFSWFKGTKETRRGRVLRQLVLVHLQSVTPRWTTLLGWCAHPASGDYGNLAIFLMLAVTFRSCPHFSSFFVCNYSSVFHVSSTKYGVVFAFPPTTPCGPFRGRNAYCIRQFEFWWEFAKCMDNPKVTPCSKPCVKKISYVLKIYWSWSITLKLALEQELE